MARAAKPYLYRGWYVTDSGGTRRKLCLEAEGFERAVTLLGRPPMLADVVPHYLRHCNDYYRLPNGKQSREPYRVRLTFADFLKLDPPLDLDRSHLITYRDQLIARGNGRLHINQTVARIVRGLRWLAEHGHIPDASAMAVRLLAPLPAFRRGVPESPGVKPVDWPTVEKTLEHLSEFWRAMILLQWHTGMRPGEVCSLRVDEVHTAGDTWVIDKGRNHKMAYKGKSKIIRIGPNGQKVLERWVSIAKAKKQMFVFRARNAVGVEAEHAPETSYCHAVARACKKAGVETWSPNQLRHAYATRLRSGAGLDAAQLMLGHSTADVTQIYAEVDLKKASELAERFG